jgi:hypothetical protein
MRFIRMFQPETQSFIVRKRKAKRMTNRTCKHTLKAPASVVFIKWQFLLIAHQDWNLVGGLSHDLVANVQRRNILGPML